MYTCTITKYLQISEDDDALVYGMQFTKIELLIFFLAGSSKQNHFGFRFYIHLLEAEYYIIGGLDKYLKLFTGTFHQTLTFFSEEYKYVCI